MANEISQQTLLQYSFVFFNESIRKSKSGCHYHFFQLLKHFPKSQFFPVGEGKLSSLIHAPFFTQATFHVSP